MPVIVTDVSLQVAKRHSLRLSGVTVALMMARPARARTVDSQVETNG